MTLQLRYAQGTGLGRRCWQMLTRKYVGWHCNWDADKAHLDRRRWHIDVDTNVEADTFGFACTPGDAMWYSYVHGVHFSWMSMCLVMSDMMYWCAQGCVDMDCMLSCTRYADAHMHARLFWKQGRLWRHVMTTKGIYVSWKVTCMCTQGWCGRHLHVAIEIRTRHRFR